MILLGNPFSPMSSYVVVCKSAARMPSSNFNSICWVVRQHLVLLVVCAPTATAIRSVAAAKPAVLSKVVLVATSALALVSQSTKTAILVALAQVTWVAAETLLLREATLAALALRVVRGRAWTSGLSSKGRRTRSTALAVGERLQGIFGRTLLTQLLLLAI